MQQTQLEQAIQLKELGVPIPDRMLIQNSTLEDKEELIDELYNQPDEQQQALKEAELNEKQLANAKTEAETEEVKSNTVLNLVRAGRDSADTDVKMNEALAGPEQQTPQAPGTDPSEIEMRGREMGLREQEFAVNTRQKDEELALKRDESKAKTLIELKKLKQAEASATQATPTKKES